MKIFDAAQTRDALAFHRLIPALHAMWRRPDVQVPVRQVHDIAAPDGRAAFTSLVMPAWLAGAGYGVKVVNIAPDNARRALPALHSSYLLHDAETGAPLALIDGDQITARRTAAASALAASWLARTDARRLLLVGTGRIARLLPAAYRCVRPIEQVLVWGRSATAAEALADELRRDGFDAHAASDLATAAAGADVIGCATLATEPLVQGRWLGAGTHLDLIGGFTPAMREADDDCFRNARVYVDVDEALVKSGDLLGPIARGVFSAHDVQGTLAALCRGQATGRRAAGERTVFKSVGTALEDLAAALLVVDLPGGTPCQTP